MRDRSDGAAAWLIGVERVRDRSKSERPTGVRECEADRSEGVRDQSEGVRPERD